MHSGDGRWGGWRSTVAAVWLALVAGCGGEGSPEDGGARDGGDASGDAAADAGTDGEVEGGATDGGRDGAVEADAAVDGSSDASSDATIEGPGSTFLWDYVAATQQYDVVYDVVIGEDGDVYVLGHIGDSFDFGGGEVKTEALGSDFVLHLDSDGEYVWEHVLPNARHHALAVDGMGRAYVVGRTEQLSVALPDDTRIDSSENYVLALSADGAFRWVFTYAIRQDERAAIAVSEDGRVYVTGGIEEDGDFGGGLREGPTEYTLALTSSGAYDWDRTFGEHRAGLLRDIVVDGAGHLYQVFSYGGSVDFGGGERSARDDGGAVLLSLDSEGAYRWDRPVETGQPQRLAVEPDGSLYYATRLYDPYDFGGGERTRVGAGDGIVVAYDTDGRYRWDHQSGIDDGDRYRDVGVDVAGNVYVVGDYLNPTSVGGGRLPNFGLSDLYLLSLSHEGHYQWDFPWGGEKSELGTVRVAGAGAGVAVVAGTFDSDADFGGGARDALRDSVFVFSHAGPP